MAIEGGCACGAVRYRAEAAPIQSMICHCADCRRAAAAPIVPWVTFARAAFAFTRGGPAVFASSPAVRRLFCAACGTPLAYENAERPDEIDVTTCSLDDAEAYPPTHHAQTADDLAWVRPGDGLPAFKAWKTTAD
jgi:hypothetical protein